jgi:hypothetical protein
LDDQRLDVNTHTNYLIRIVKEQTGANGRRQGGALYAPALAGQWFSGRFSPGKQGRCSRKLARLAGGCNPNLLVFRLAIFKPADGQSYRKAPEK